MNERIRELFEKHTVPNFSVSDNIVLTMNKRGEYINPVLEDHWQTFQEAAELIVRKCVRQVDKSNYNSGDEWDKAMECAANNIREHFGVE